ncbi:hypothetical protein LSH36_111g01017, partial [Paralvinella palmiformis]
VCVCVWACVCACTGVPIPPTLNTSCHGSCRRCLVPRYDVSTLTRHYCWGGFCGLVGGWLYVPSPKNTNRRHDQYSTYTRPVATYLMKQSCYNIDNLSFKYYQPEND